MPPTQLQQDSQTMTITCIVMVLLHAQDVPRCYVLRMNMTRPVQLVVSFTSSSNIDSSVKNWRLFHGSRDSRAPSSVLSVR